MRDVVEAAPAVEALFALTSQARIVNPEYGTRCSTVCFLGQTIRYAERTFAADGAEGETVYFALSTEL